MQSVFESSRTEFLAQLSDEDKLLLRDCTSPESFRLYLSTANTSHHVASNTRKAVDFSQQLVTGLLRFAKAIDVFCNSQPEVMLVLWGGLRVVLHVAESFREFFDAIMSSLQMLGCNLSRVGLYESLFPNAQGVRECLQELYKQLLQFFLDTKRLFRSAAEGKQRRYLPRRLRIAFRAMLSAFQADVGLTEIQMTRTLDRLDREAQAASYVESKSAQGKQEAEYIAANQHRYTVATESSRQIKERMAQDSERQEQSDWRAMEATFWEKQMRTNASLISAITDDARRSLFKWLSPTSSEDHHESALRLRYPGTCTWILDTPEFALWSSEVDQLLWIHGIPGAGKTVLAASIIKHLQDSSCPDEAVTYYYFDHRGATGQNARSFLASIITSLATQSMEYLAVISTRLNKARAVGRSPNINILQECIQECPRHFENVFIVIDGLDEISDSEEMLSQLRFLIGDGKEKVKVLVTSRTTKNLEDFFEDAELDHLTVKLEPELTQPDISRYVKGAVDEMILSKRLKLRDLSLGQDITFVLSKKAMGMFQWVKCQLIQIRKLKSDKAIRNCLQKLPKNLAETYVRALKLLLQHHNTDEILQIQRLFRWLVHATRPLDVEEMAEMISVDFGQDSFDVSAVITDPFELLSYGESLITLSGDKRCCLHLSHFSVKEFLLSDYCLQELPEFYMDITRSNAQIATVCLTALSLSEFAFTEEDESKAVQTCPRLYSYAMSYWAFHFNLAYQSESCPKALAISLLTQVPENPNFHAMRKYLHRNADYLPIHYCAQHGLPDICRIIVNTGININIQSEPYGSPLNFAARYDQPLVSELLLDHGADVNNAILYDNMKAANNCLHWSMDEERVFFVSIRLVKYIAETPGLDVNSLAGRKSLQRPLHYAAWAGRPDLIEVLLSCGAEIDSMDESRRTPLHVALEAKRLDAVEFLLDQGASMIRADKCDSMRESGFGLSNALQSSISEARWEVAALLRSHKPTSSRPSHWGFALGEAAQQGQLETVKSLLDDNVKLPSSTRTNSIGGELDAHASFIQIGDLEAKVGTMFAALDLALHGRYFEVAMLILERMAVLFEIQQGQPTASAELDIHAVMIHDRPDVPFIEGPWSESILFLSMILGHLRIAQLLLEKINFEMIQVLAPPILQEIDIPYEMQLIICLGWRNETYKKITNTAQQKFRQTSLLDEGMSFAFSQQGAFEEDVSRMCEQARLLWKAKRNPKAAFDIFFHEYFIEDNRHPQIRKSSIVGLLLKLGVDVNSLDLAGRTPYYWAHVRLWTDLCMQLEALGGQLLAPPESSLKKIKASILSMLKDLDSSSDGAATTLDLSRKWDWDNLARYLFFSGDTENACRAFEAGAVFDLRVPGEVPAFHYFICDACHTEYRDDHLLRGPRFVPLGLVNIDLCHACANVFGPYKLEIPSPEWIRSQRAAHEEEISTFARLDEEFQDDILRDRAKAEWKRNAAMRLTSRVEDWVRELKETWGTEDQTALLERYKNKQEELIAWLTKAETAHRSVADLERW